MSTDKKRNIIKSFVSSLSNGQLFSFSKNKTEWDTCELSKREYSIINEAIRICNASSRTANEQEKERYDYLQERLEETVKSCEENRMSTDVPPEEQVFWSHAAEYMLEAYSYMPAKSDRMENWEKAVLRKMSREEQSALQSMPTYQTFAEKASYLAPIFASILNFKKNFDGADDEENPSSRQDTMDNISDQIKDHVK